MATRFLEETLWAISAAKVALCLCEEEGEDADQRTALLMLMVILRDDRNSVHSLYLQRFCSRLDPSGTSHEGCPVTSRPGLRRRPSFVQSSSLLLLSHLSMSPATALPCLNAIDTHINKSSTSFGLLTTNRRRPLGIMCRVFLLEPQPIEGMTVTERNLLRTEESIPLGFLQLVPTRSYRSEWCRGNDLVRFLTILTILLQR